MAVEVRELVIRAVVVKNASGSEGGNEDDCGCGSNGASGIGEKESIVQDCVNQVLKILKKSNKR